MTKAEILEAINATIAPNGVKGITAESLANILTEIVNAAGEGGAGGEYLDMTLANPDDTTSTELTPEAMAHNAALYTSICEILNNGGVLPPVSANADGLGLYASSVTLESDLLMFCFHRPFAIGPSNYFVEAITKEDTSEPTELSIGSDLMLFFLILHQDGSITIFVPSVM